jgi:hypothetical protein
VYRFKSKAGEAIGDFVVSCKSHSGHQMEGCKQCIVVVKCVNTCGNPYLSKGITKESEVADTGSSTATAFTNAKLGVGFRPKTQNRAFVARFWARCMKQRCRAVLGGGGCRLVTQRW